MKRESMKNTKTIPNMTEYHRKERKARLKRRYKDQRLIEKMEEKSVEELPTT